MPKISIIVPTFNSEKFVDECLSNLFAKNDSNAPELEVIVVDGASQDGTLAKVEKYADRMTKVISEPDRGIYDAINKGMAQSTGEIMTWISSNDILPSAALAHVHDIFEVNPKVNFLTGLYTVIINEQGLITYTMKRPGVSKASFLYGCHTEGILPCSSGYIQQEGTFWRRSLWLSAGGYVSTEYGPAGDFELWTRFFQISDIACVRSALAYFRLHEKQTSVQQVGSYGQMAQKALETMQAKFSHSPQDPKGTEVVKYSQQVIQDLKATHAEYFIIGANRDNGILKVIARGDHFG